MGLFSKKKKDSESSVVNILPVLKAQNVKKLSIFSVEHQAYHEITIDEYVQKLRALGLSEDEIATKLKDISGE